MIIKIDHKNTPPFYITPEDITFRMRYHSWLEDLDSGHHPMLDAVIPNLENEAIYRLKKELPDLAEQEPRPTTLEEMEDRRLWWLNEAMQNCDKFQPVGRAGEHLTAVGQAAVNVLIVASELRVAIEYKQSEKAAALGMLLICEALQGGLWMDFSSIQEARSKAYEKGIGNQSENTEKVKKAAITFARKQWTENQNLRIGEVSNLFLAHLREHKSKLPTLEAFPKIDTIKGWFKEANETGRLAIPATAQRRGRPPKESK